MNRSLEQFWALRALIQGGGLARVADDAARVGEILRRFGLASESTSYADALKALRNLVPERVDQDDAGLATPFDLDDEEAQLLAFAALRTSALLQIATDTLGVLTRQQSFGAVATIVGLPDKIVATTLSPARRLIRGDFIRLAPDALAILRHRFRLGSAVAIELAAVRQVEHRSRA